VVILATALSLVIGVPLGLVAIWVETRPGVAVLMDTIYTLPGLLLSVTLAFVVWSAECRDRYQHLLHPQYYALSAITPRA